MTCSVHEELPQPILSGSLSTLLVEVEEQWTLSLSGVNGAIRSLGGTKCFPSKFPKTIEKENLGWQFWEEKNLSISIKRHKCNNNKASKLVC